MRKLEKRNLLHIEFMRIIAAYLVIFNHTQKKGFFLFSCFNRGSMKYWGYMSISIFCKVAVFLFLMIAGALLLKKDIDLKTIWIKKISRMAGVLLVFSIVMYLGFGMEYGFETYSIMDFVKKIYTNQISTIYWYLYVYIAFLMALPFLRAIVKTIKEVHYKYIFILYIVFTAIIPCVEYCLFQGNIRMYSGVSPSWLFTNIVFWPLMGYYVENVFDIKKCTKKLLGIWGLLSLIGIGISSYLTYYMHGITGICEEDSSQMFFATFIVFPCIMIYIGTKYYVVRHKITEFSKNIIKSIGKCSFGIYLIHILVKDLLSGLGIWKIFRKEWQLNYMFSALLFCALTFAICYGVIFVLKKVPGLKQML